MTEDKNKMFKVELDHENKVIRGNIKMQKG